MNYGKRIYKLIQLLWPLNRSLTGNDNRKTLKLLKNINPKLKIKEVKSGTKVFKQFATNKDGTMSFIDLRNYILQFWSAFVTFCQQMTWKKF